MFRQIRFYILYINNQKTSLAINYTKLSFCVSCMAVFLSRRFHVSPAQLKSHHLAKLIKLISHLLILRIIYLLLYCTVQCTDHGKQLIELDFQGCICMEKIEVHFFFLLGGAPLCFNVRKLMYEVGAEDCISRSPCSKHQQTNIYNVGYFSCANFQAKKYVKQNKHNHNKVAYHSKS